MAESGATGTEGFEVDQWYGMVAPAGTPADVIERLDHQIHQTLGSAEVASRLAAEGAEATPATEKAFGEPIERNTGRWKQVIKVSKICDD